MILIQPEQGVCNEEITHFVSAKVEYKSPPFRMFSLAGITMFVKGSAVEEPQAPVVFREMRRDPVDDDSDAVLVARVHKVLEIIRVPEAARWGIITCHLIAPGGVKRMLGHG